MAKNKNDRKRIPVDHCPICGFADVRYLRRIDQFYCRRCGNNFDYEEFADLVEYVEQKGDKNVKD